MRILKRQTGPVPVFAVGRTLPIAAEGVAPIRVDPEWAGPPGGLASVVVDVHAQLQTRTRNGKNLISNIQRLALG
jgi:hypothetical protein